MSVYLSLVKFKKSDVKDLINEAGAFTTQEIHGVIVEVPTRSIGWNDVYILKEDIAYMDNNHLALAALRKLTGASDGLPYYILDYHHFNQVDKFINWGTDLPAGLVDSIDVDLHQLTEFREALKKLAGSVDPATEIAAFTWC